MTIHAVPLRHLAALTPQRRQLTSLLGPTGNFSPIGGPPPPDSQAAAGSNSQPAGSTTNPSTSGSTDQPPGGTQNPSTSGNTSPSTEKAPGSGADTSPGATTGQPPGQNSASPALPSAVANPNPPAPGSTPTEASTPTLATPTPAAAAAVTPSPAPGGSNQQQPSPSDASILTPTPLATPTTPDALSPLSTPTPVGKASAPISDPPLTAPSAIPTLGPTPVISGLPVIATSHDSHGQLVPITSVVNVPGVRTAPAPVATKPFSTASTQGQSKNESSGLSTGAITVIAIIAGIIGFIILFWLGVQLLQSKRRKREEADMQEIDFDPSGGGSANGDTFHALGIDRNPSSANGHGTAYNQKHSPHDSTEKPYDEDPHMYAGYPGPPTTPAPTGLAEGGGVDEMGGPQRQATGGGRSLHSNPSIGAGPQAYYSGPYYPGDPRQQYSQSSAPGHFSPPQHRFDTSPPMPPHPYDYGNGHGVDGPDYASDPHNPPYRGHVGANNGVGYGTMIARSTSPPLNFHYPPNSTATAI